MPQCAFPTFWHVSVIINLHWQCCHSSLNVLVFHSEISRSWNNWKKVAVLNCPCVYFRCYRKFLPDLKLYCNLFLIGAFLGKTTHTTNECYLCYSFRYVYGANIEQGCSPNRKRTGTSAHGEREPISGVWGPSPQRGPGAEPLVRWRSPLKLKAF